MKANNPQKQQQWRLFIKELIAFALLFLSLGLIIYLFFSQSVYRNIDHSLTVQKHQLTQKNPRASVEKAPPRFQNGRDFSQPPSVNSPFRTNEIIFNSKGKIENAAALGNRTYQLFSKAKLNPNNLNKIQDMTLTYNNITSHFRSLLIKVPNSNPDKRTAGKYVLILENVDSDLLAINSFKNALIGTLLVFWLLAIAVAFLLSKSSMKPIIKSWQRQREFSSNAAHELRTPLTVIQNQMESMLTKPRATIMSEIDAVSTTLDETRHLKILTDRLLTLARSDSDIIQIRKHSVDLKPWFESILPPYLEIATSQNKAFTSWIETDATADIDSDLIRQLVTIIFDNAFKYTKSGDSIGITVLNDDRNFTIRISNTGEKIPDRDKKHIFERFYRTDKSRNSATGGHGLGLAIAQWIVTEHHGKIAVRDQQPKGTIFEIQIPLA
ncbi:cell wall metabolism sensor histidine kinase WalK [Lactobacillus sp. Sy-1]|uniref:sensor histidine kinase n=1 Tax=Lactobacillus sp. Sy-1 TaxID=2109645 RepID=UPI001C5B8481|nr:HAMP domain-containing sensor histidine kinase [Lactobacillus sp. Sy-1]MBW1606370.1 HAMP domain-containing histidine kinase [Lactobacillus sp. Sy-1]